MKRSGPGSPRTCSRASGHKKERTSRQVIDQLLATALSFHRLWSHGSLNMPLFKCLCVLQSHGW